MKKPALADKDLLTPTEAARLFGLSRGKLYQFCNDGSYRFIAHFGKDRKLIVKDELQKYLAQPGVKEALEIGIRRTKKGLETQDTPSGRINQGKR